MYEVQLCSFVEDEASCEKSNWLIADAFGEYETRREAEYVAAQLACCYYEFIAFYCATHGCDGVSFDVIDRTIDNAVTAYELSAAGQVSEWRETECHEWRMV